MKMVALHGMVVLPKMFLRFLKRLHAEPLPLCCPAVKEKPRRFRGSQSVSHMFCMRVQTARDVKKVYVSSCVFKLKK